VTKQGDSPDVFIIAEIGINHNGDLDVAKKLIDQSKAAGCDAVKNVPSRSFTVQIFLISLETVHGGKLNEIKKMVWNLGVLSTTK
jgi:hypothetical protein